MVPTITTDAATYAAGATVTYTGTGWNNCTNLKIDLFGPGGFTLATDVMPDAAGAFTGTFTAPLTGSFEFILNAQSLTTLECDAHTTFSVVPTIRTDAPTYAPGATVTYTGTAWNNCTNVKIDLFGPGGFTLATDVMPDAAGAFTGTFTAPTTTGFEFILNAQSLTTLECDARTTFTVVPTTTTSPTTTTTAASTTTTAAETTTTAAETTTTAAETTTTAAETTTTAAETTTTAAETTTTAAETTTTTAETTTTT
jgi:hypothetical protein